MAVSGSGSLLSWVCTVQNQPMLVLGVPNPHHSNNHSHSHRNRNRVFSFGNMKSSSVLLDRSVSVVVGVTQGSAESSKSDENIPSWAKPDSDEPPPWARDEPNNKNAFEIPFYVYLLASAVTAIAAIGSVFEYVNQRPVFGVLSSDSVFYAPLLGFFAVTGIPSSAFLWFKSVQAANKEAEEQDKRDGYL